MTLDCEGAGGGGPNCRPRLGRGRLFLTVPFASGLSPQEPNKQQTTCKLDPVSIVFAVGEGNCFLFYSWRKAHQ